jgi:hypothetical protein
MFARTAANRWYTRPAIKRRSFARQIAAMLGGTHTLKWRTEKPRENSSAKLAAWNLRAMAIKKTENSALDFAMGSRGGFGMTDQNVLFRYKTAIAVYKEWLKKGLITQEEYRVISTTLADNLGISSKSIYCENDLLCVEFRANMG